MLNQDELKRYNRHIIMSEVKLQGQEKLKQAKVLVIGAGGLGCPVLQYLTAAGAGTIGVIDDDKVDISNLQRQILFRTDDVGKFKAEAARDNLLQLNPHTNWDIYTTRLTKNNALTIFKEYDVVVDGTDNFETRYLINDACIISNIPFVFGSIFKFDGQVSVFNLNGGPTYRCLFPEPPEEMPNCSQVGVIGVLPGIIGSYQANETLKIILELGDHLSGKLLSVDTLSNQNSIISFRKVEGNDRINELGDYSIYQNVACEIENNLTISVDELAEKIELNEDLFLLDVREQFEVEICQLPQSINIPLDRLTESIAEIPRNKEIVIYCHHGHRSKEAAQLLTSRYGFSKVLSLDGGIHDWSIEIDNSIEQY